MQPTQSVTFSVVEASSAIFRDAPQDENGSACSASAVAWTLSDEAGNVINGRQSVSLIGSGSASAFVIFVSGLDTTRQPTEPYIPGVLYLRVLKIAGWYNSPTTGLPAPLVNTYTFNIVPVPVEGP